MPRFSANISMLFAEHAFPDRFAAAADAGFAAVEMLFPYDHDPDRLGALIDRAGLRLSVFNLHPGDWRAGDRGFAALPGGRAAAEDSARRALPYARAMGARRLHCTAGLAAPTPEAEARYVDAIRAVADILGAEEIDTLIEPINPRDMPGYFLSTTAQAMALLDRIDHPRVRLQFDCYHHQITRGDVIRSLEAALPRIAHVQIAGVPDRHEPDTGELAYGAVFAALDRVGYGGWVGCEYHPATTTLAGLGWIDALR